MQAMKSAFAPDKSAVKNRSMKTVAPQRKRRSNGIK
jgi:hypothetical protein